jgi:hypothetical protein
MNKRPVTDTMVSVLDWRDCRSSANGGRHSTSNFRSDHPGGCLFVHADGSVHFLHETTDDSVYHSLSTIAGEESPEIP